MAAIQHKIKGQKSFRPMSEINVVPYIDVMLVLLVIFMITAPLLMQGVNVNLPKAQAQALSHEREPIVISVDSSGNYYLNIAPEPSKPIVPYVLQSYVRQELQSADNQGGKRPVFVKGDEKANYGAVVNVMVLLKIAGAESIGLITEPEKEKLP